MTIQEEHRDMNHPFFFLLKRKKKQRKLSHEEITEVFTSNDI